MEGYTQFGTIIVINALVNQVFVEEIHDLIALIPGVRIGLTVLAVPGFALRVLANTTQDIEKILSYCHESIRNRLLEKEAVFLRKY
ncbi:hypothetical protein V7152_18450 [Neobacillus drentensis]|uniref:hypothetical protein n=1 Tax=Neobacillus drentensis TaxID=220684 RepID=UPI003000379E